MDSETNDAIIQFVLSYRQQLPTIARPEKAWIRLHKPISREQEYTTNPINSSISRAWFLEDEIVKERKVDEFSRFAAAHIDRPWSSAEFDFPPSPLYDKYKHEFGHVWFAKFEDANEYLLAMSWGGLNGRGLVIGMQDSRMIAIRELWKA
jgi:hypothetical protein